MPAFCLGPTLESIRKSEFEQAVLRVCDGPLRERGFRIVDIDGRPGRRSLVRLYIDSVEEASPPGPGKVPGAKVTLDDCATVSRAIGETLDLLPEIPGPYDLEVSSPGLDRRLRLRSDFESAVGRTVRLKLGQRQAGGVNVSGQLEGVEGAEIVVRVGREERRLALQDVIRANVVWSEDERASHPSEVGSK